jgi:hypothetical protein
MGRFRLNSSESYTQLNVSFLLLPLVVLPQKGKFASFADQLAIFPDINFLPSASYIFHVFMCIIFPPRLAICFLHFLSVNNIL